MATQSKSKASKGSKKEAATRSFLLSDQARKLNRWKRQQRSWHMPACKIGLVPTFHPPPVEVVGKFPSLPTVQLETFDVSYLWLGGLICFRPDSFWIWVFQRLHKDQIRPFWPWFWPLNSRLKVVTKGRKLGTLKRSIDLKKWTWKN